MKPRVAIFAGMFKEKSDGSARSLIQLSKSLSKQGIEHRVFSPCVDEFDSSHLSVFEVTSMPIFFYPEYKIGFFSKKVRQALEQFKPDVIHVSTPDLTGHGAAKYAKKHNIPLVASFHTHFPSYLPYYKLGFLQNWIWKKLRQHYNQCQAIFAPTKIIQDELLSQDIVGLGKNKDNHAIKIWSRGIHETMFSPKKRDITLRKTWGGDDKFYVLYVGRLVWYKNLECIKKVYEHFSSHQAELMQKIKFCFVGDGPAREVLKNQMPKAHFFGSVKPEKIGQYYASADVLFFPSTTETFGQVVQEALASGCPAMVSDQGGCQEIVKESQAGYVFSEQDIKAYSAGIQELVVDLTKRQDLQRKALAYAKTKQWDQVNQTVIDVYKDLLNPSVPLQKNRKLG